MPLSENHFGSSSLEKCGILNAPYSNPPYENIVWNPINYSPKYLNEPNGFRPKNHI